MTHQSKQHLGGGKVFLFVPVLSDKPDSTNSSTDHFQYYTLMRKDAKAINQVGAKRASEGNTAMTIFLFSSFMFTHQDLLKVM